MVLAVLLLVGADVRPQGAARPADKTRGTSAYLFAFVQDLDFEFACGVPGDPSTLPGFAGRNQADAAAFGERPRLDPRDVLRHFPCVVSISAELDSYRQLGLVTQERVRATLGGFGLWDVQVEPASDGLRFGGAISNVCIAGIYMPRRTVVVVISQLPNQRCLS